MSPTGEMRIALAVEPPVVELLMRTKPPTARITRTPLTVTTRHLPNLPLTCTDVVPSRPVSYGDTPLISVIFQG